MLSDEALAADANARGIERVLASESWLVDVRLAGEVVPGLASNQVLCAAPSAPWRELSPLIRSGAVSKDRASGYDRAPVEGG